MKKLFALLLAVLMVFSLTACSQITSILKGEEPEPLEKNPLLVAYVELSGDAICSSLESSFANLSGMTCAASIEVVGNGLEVFLNINELDDASQEEIQKLTDSYTFLNNSLGSALEFLNVSIPGLESMKIHLCENDGDLLTTIDVLGQ